VRFIIDAQLPPALADVLRRKGHDAAVARVLPMRGGAIAFDPLSMGASPGADRAANLALASRINSEAIAVARRCGEHLPTGCSVECFEAVAEHLQAWTLNA
jgi:hypothetical protein